MAKVGVIGAGFSGLSAAAYLAAAGHEVHVFEKNESPGGRARQIITSNGYVFDMGPSWYWMPGVFERFFKDFETTVSGMYDLKLLDPSFNVVFGQGENMLVPADYGALREMFESIEKGSGLRLDQFMKQAKLKYEVGMENLVYKPGLSIVEFLNAKTLVGALQSQLFTSFSKHVRRFFSHPKLLSLMEFPVLFLGAMPEETPALYSLMNYAGLKLGNWYPMGGFGSVTRAMQEVAESHGAKFHFNSPVQKVVVEGGCACRLLIDGQLIEVDGIIAAADYSYVEDKLLPEANRNYDESFWDKKTFAPSCLIYYVGINKTIPALHHHNLFFDEDLFQHSMEIYKDAKWPSKPLFYVCNPSKTDPSVAPSGHENLFFLMPIAPGLEDNETTREQYFSVMLQRLERFTGEKSLSNHIDFKKSYCIADFIADYHSYKGNAYGLANTLRQTAVLKPKIRNWKIRNLFYAGQLTVPGPGVPPSIISGKIAAEQLLKYIKRSTHEVVI